VARTGKIARLRKEHRDKVNEMLRDNASSDRVIKFVLTLKDAGERDANGDSIQIPNDQNITNWREGGFQDWLKEQERLQDMRAKREFALEIVKANEGSMIHEAGLQIAATQIYELLQDFDVKTLKEKLAGDPENYARIVNAIAKLNDVGLKFERYREEVSRRKENIARELNRAKTKGGITPETLEQIEAELKLL